MRVRPAETGLPILGTVIGLPSAVINFNSTTKTIVHLCSLDKSRVVRMTISTSQKEILDQSLALTMAIRHLALHPVWRQITTLGPPLTIGVTTLRQPTAGDSPPPTARPTLTYGSPRFRKETDGQKIMRRLQERTAKKSISVTPVRVQHGSNRGYGLSHHHPWILFQYLR